MKTKNRQRKPLIIKTKTKLTRSIDFAGQLLMKTNFETLNKLIKVCEAISNNTTLQYTSADIRHVNGSCQIAYHPLPEDHIVSPKS